MITFVVNGQTRSVDVPGDVPLLWVLREELGLTGTKFGCGMALCGVCTVHVDGSPARSCVVPVAEVAGKSVVTIEGLGAGTLHAVQKAWIAENVPQCGYCQPGQVMSAVALLRAKRDPTDEEIDAVLSANLCRCGTYVRIKKAVRRAAAELASVPATGAVGAADGGVVTDASPPNTAPLDAAAPTAAAPDAGSPDAAP